MSSDEILIVGKLLLTFGVLLGLPIWELVSLRREQRGEARRSADARPPPEPMENLAPRPVVEDRARRYSGPCS